VRIASMITGPLTTVVVAVLSSGTAGATWGAGALIFANTSTIIAIKPTRIRITRILFMLSSYC
jgi:hypothetical protein